MKEENTPSTAQQAVDLCPEPELSMARYDSNFDYSALDHETADLLWQSAEGIRTGLNSVAKNVLQIGLYLDAARDRLPRGQFGPWLKSELGWSPRNAQLYMRTAKVLGDKCEIISLLGAKLSCDLAAKRTPQSVRNDILARFENDGLKPTRREVQAELQTAWERGASDRSRKEGRTTTLPRLIQSQTPALEGPHRTSDVPDVPPEADVICRGEERQPAEQAVDLIVESVGNGAEELLTLLEDADSADFFGRLLSSVKSAVAASNANYEAENSAGSRVRTH